MKSGRASRTAHWAAICRAVESRKPESQRVCYDPFAERFLSLGFRAIGKCLPWRVLSDLLDRRFPWAVREIVARTRYIDDFVQKGVSGGATQLVILGAGYDSRAYRIEGLRGRVRVFEVDHPATQRDKKQKVRHILGKLPSHVVYVPVEFGSADLAMTLERYGYSSQEQSIYVWEGVSMYLSPMAVDDTLAFFRDYSGPGSSLIFNYVYQSVVEGSHDCGAAKEWKRVLGELGEPIRFGVPEGQLERFLCERRLGCMGTVDGRYLARVYFDGLSSEKAPPPFLATAIVVHDMRATSER